MSEFYTEETHKAVLAMLSTVYPVFLSPTSILSSHLFLSYFLSSGIADKPFFREERSPSNIEPKLRVGFLFQTYNRTYQMAPQTFFWIYWYYAYS